MKSKHSRAKSTADVLTKVFAAVGAAAVGLKAIRLGLQIFGPTDPFYLEDSPGDSPESDQFAARLACVTDAIIYRDTRIDVLRNGSEFYPAELQAIDEARESINLEAFIFYKGNLTGDLLRRLIERARAGVQVRLVIDKMGSLKTGPDYFAPLIKAGGKMVYYHPLKVRDVPYLDNRTHRKLLIVDGRVGFIGGAGFADHWLTDDKGKPPWRDTMFRVEGSVVQSLNATFAQNWVAATGEILFSEKQFPKPKSGGDKSCMIVMSTPGYGATRARILFQTLLETAKRSVQITTPYFLPDRSAREAIIRAVRERGVRVQVLTVGAGTDHNSVRYLSEATASKLIKAGVEFYEYQPGMLHAKLMTIDGQWTIAGSTNFDYRSFALNDEVNIAVCNDDISAVVEQQFADDLKQSRCMSPNEVRPKTLAAQVITEASWVMRREE